MGSPGASQPVSIEVDGAALQGDLVLVPAARGLVIFAHGSGSSRHSSRNRHVAEILQKGGFATLLFDLLTLREEAQDARTGHLRFDIGLLGRRLAGVVAWAGQDERTKGMPMGLFGASTGAAAALVAAAAEPDRVGAVVSRGGRPDLAPDALPQVKAPTLLIVGGLDGPVIRMNQWALERLRAPKELVIVPGASHLFEEPGKLDEVARLARGWFERYL
jgi:putative phosphoribosyl transferase